MDTGVWLTKSRADIRIQCLCIDTNDPAKTAQFWQAALGWRRTFDEEDQIVLEPPEGSPEDGIVPDLLFLRVPDSTTAGFLEPKARGQRPGPSFVWACAALPIAGRQVWSTVSEGFPAHIAEEHEEAPESR